MGKFLTLLYELFTTLIVSTKSALVDLVFVDTIWLKHMKY